MDYMNIVYEMALAAYACFALPKMVYQKIFQGKYKDSFWKKWGKDFPVIKKNGKKLVWIHAVSVGESKAMAPFVKLLRQSEPSSIILISSTTETGHAEVKKSIPEADYYVYLPVDLEFIIKPIVKRISPDVVILCETDWWYNFLAAAKEVGASIVVINGKISERSQSRFGLFSAFTHQLFSLIDCFCVQSSLYSERFKSLGVSSEKLKVTGNLKFDAPLVDTPPEELAAWKKQFQLSPEDPVIVIGSSHDSEESQLLEALEVCWKMHPTLKVLIVPRHPERFDAVAELIESKGICFSRLSKGGGGGEVVLIDAMGVLRKCYEIATVAIVAGSYTDKVGGHNILEPLYYSVPVIFGPYMHSQPELVEMVLGGDAGIQSSISQVGANVNGLLRDFERCHELGRNGLRVIEENLGASKNTLEVVLSFISK
jgi:3-deoxy-D-manno-octulosonic-acid transferase